MAKILIAYGTNSSGTLFASKVLCDFLQSKEHIVDMMEVRLLHPNIIEGYDLIIFGTNTWFYNGSQGQPHIWFFPFEKEFRKLAFNNKKFAILALGDSSYIEFCHSADYLEKMISESGGILTISSLRIDGYFFDEAQNNKRIQDWAAQLSV